MLYQNSTKLKPLLFFESFIKKEMIEKYECLFFNSPLNASQTFNLEEGYIEYLNDTYINEDVKVIRVYFKENLEKLLQNNLTLSINFIEEREIELNYQNSKTDIFIQSLLHKILRIKNSMSKLEKYQGLFIQMINNLENYLISKDQQPKLALTKKIIKPSSTKSYFDLKEGIFSRHLKQLYAVAINFEIVNDEELPEEIFVNIFQSTLLPLENLRFNFHADNRKAIVYLKTIKPLFKNLTPARMAESKTFYTKQRKKLDSKLLNANDFYKVNTDLKKNPTIKYQPLIEAIKSAFPKGF